MAKMSTPLYQGGYAGGGDVAGGTYVSTASAYQNMFDKIESGTKEFMKNQGSDPEKEAKRLEKRKERMEGRKQTDGRKRRIAKVDKKIEGFSTAKEEKEKAQQEYNTWLVSDGASASEQEKKNYKESLGLI